MTTKKLLAAGAIAAGVAVGGIGGAMIGVPNVSSAIEADDGTDAADESGPGFRRGPGHRPNLAAAAEAIGISEDELRAALQDGQSIADVATANGVDVQVVVDALVADATERIDEAVASGDLDAERAEEIKANLDERVTALVNGELGDGPGHHRHGPGLGVAAETIGITEEELRDALADGQTVAEVAEANGVDPQAVIDALVAQATERITAFVNGDAD